MGRIFVTCGHCNRSYPAVFRNDDQQGYRCATVREDRILIGHYGSVVADGTRYAVNDGYPVPDADLFCDPCVEHLIETGVISEIIENASDTADNEEGPNFMLEVLRSEST